MRAVRGGPGRSLELSSAPTGRSCLSTPGCTGPRPRYERVCESVVPAKTALSATDVTHVRAGMSALRIALTAAVDGGAATLPAWKRLLEWYSMKLLTDPIKTKGLTSMFVNPIGGMVGQIIKDGKVTNWHEIKWFLIWGLGLGTLHTHSSAFVHWWSVVSASGCQLRAQALRRTTGTSFCRFGRTSTNGI